jgi:hypothetical protein
VRILLRSLGLVAALSALGPAAAHARIEVISPDELAGCIVPDKDGAHLLIDGRSIALVTDPSDSSLSKLGDGAFHPMDVAQVQAAVRETLGPTLPDARVLILPYPRRDVLQSCCEGDVVFLAPGIRPVPAEHVHATVAHELGHVLENTLCPDGSAAWVDYLNRRALHDARYSADAVHRDRPREIFAEDFRFLRGDGLATSSGSIENPDLPLPSDVEGLADWFASLGAVSLLAPTVSTGPAPLVAPNPFRAAGIGSVVIRFAVPGEAHGVATADVFDLTGRHVRTLTGAPDGSGVEFRWDGADASGLRVGSGVYFVRWQDRSNTTAARVHILH